MIRRCTIAIAIGLCAAVAVARAQPSDPAAKAKANALFEKGQSHYQAGQYQAAIPLFKEAYDLVHDPVYLFNVAQTYRKIFDCEGAADYFKRYLDTATDADAVTREKVQTWISELQPCVEQRQKEHALARRGEEAERERRAELARQRAQPTEIDRGGTYRLGGIALGVVGVGGLAAGVAFSIHGSTIKHDLATACSASCNWEDPAIADQDRAGRRANMFAIIGWVGGGAALAGGIALYVVGRSRVEHVDIAPTAGGATVSTHWSF